MQFLHRIKDNIILSLSLLLLASPVAAQGDPWASAEGFFADFEAFLTNIAAVAAVIGFLGLTIMYLGSSFPLGFQAINNSNRISHWLLELFRVAPSIF